MVFQQLKDPLELFVKRREFLSCRNMTLAVKSHVKTQTFLPFQSRVAAGNMVT